MPRTPPHVSDADLRFEWIAGRFRGDFAESAQLPHIRAMLVALARRRKRREERMRRFPDTKRRQAGDTE
ncbi:hypothetical protein SAMN05216551_105297 [Chitinasiproducens palmae]|uniref:Uncharacterized protein n=1 Tax=Chitinasiproducens palmae TaxID=1770053 RepID=A0A1H2PPI7_9BURK|nr:hypothetical protein SAMN05216551_105297 [Chitinasiproducens palmae]